MTIEGLVDEHRCRAVHGARRCQLWAGHDGEHAAWWRPDRHVAPGHPPGRLLPARTVLWTDDGRSREVEPGSVRLRWAAMGLP